MILNVHTFPTFDARQAFRAALYRGILASLEDQSDVCQPQDQFELTPSKGRVVPCVRLDWARSLGRALYFRDTKTKTDILPYEGSCLALQALAAMEPKVCPVPYLQRTAWLFVDHLFDGTMSPSLALAGREPLSPERAARFTALRNVFNAFLVNTSNPSAVTDFYKACEHTLSTVTLSDYLMRKAGLKDQPGVSLIDLTKLREFAKAPAPEGFSGIFQFDVENEISAIFSLERLGVFKSGSARVIYLPAYIRGVVASGNIVPWMLTQADRDAAEFDPTTFYPKVREFLHTHLAGQPEGRAVNAWALITEAVPFNPDTVLMFETLGKDAHVVTPRPIDPTVDEPQIVKSLVKPKDHVEIERRLLTTGQSTETVNESTMFAVGIPPEHRTWLTDTHLRFVWPHSGVHLNPALFAGHSYETLETAYVDRYERDTDDTEERPFHGMAFRAPSAKREFSRFVHPVDKAHWVHIEAILYALPQLPEAVREFLLETFGQSRKNFISELRKPVIAEARAEGRKVRCKKPFTYQEDRLLWDHNARYASASHWEALHRKMPHHSMVRVRRRASLLALCRANGMLLEDCQKPVNIRNHMPLLPDYYATVM